VAAQDCQKTTTSGIGHLVCNRLVAALFDNKQIDLRPADPFTRIDPKLNQVVPWSLHTFPENFMQIVQPLSRNLANKERNKEIAR